MNPLVLILLGVAVLAVASGGGGGVQSRVTRRLETATPQSLNAQGGKNVVTVPVPSGVPGSIALMGTLPFSVNDAAARTDGTTYSFRYEFGPRGGNSEVVIVIKSAAPQTLTLVLL